MELSVQIETTSPVVRKLTVRVPAKEVASRFERGLVEVQRTARLKGFRPGHAPMSVIKQFYGDDVRHRLFHSLIDESFQEAVRSKQLKAVGSPKIETPEHKTGEGEHDHALNEDKDLTYVATVEVLPEIEVKGYTGVALTKQEQKITDEDVEKMVKGLVDSQAELVPVGGGLVMADGSQSSRPVQKGDFVDLSFDGGMVTETGVERREGMKGDRVIEVGSESLIPGFEDNLIGMRRGETKTFRIPFPKDYFEKDLAGKDAEFTVTANEVKEKKLPELNDDFVKQMGYENVADLRKKAKEHITREKESETDRKLRGDLVEQLIEKNKFDVPQALIEAQTRALAQDWAQELKRQGLDDQSVQGAIVSELDNLKKRAEGQVRASLILEAVARQESIEVKSEEYETELKNLAGTMKVDESQLREYYAKNPGRREDFVFRLRQERTLKFLLDKAKIKSKG